MSGKTKWDVLDGVVRRLFKVSKQHLLSASILLLVFAQYFTTGDLYGGSHVCTGVSLSVCPSSAELYKEVGDI